MTFYLTNLTFSLAIQGLYPTIQYLFSKFWEKSQKCKVLTCNCERKKAEFWNKSHNYLIYLFSVVVEGGISLRIEFKKSELWDINLELWDKKVWILSLHLTIMTSFLRIASLYLAMLSFYLTIQYFFSWIVKKKSECKI